ncbi:MAG: MBL fold metallo-hydrolase [Promethearchaeota archaeon]
MMYGTTVDTSSRFYHSGEVDEGVHLIDLHMYDSSLFANSCFFKNEEISVIIDAGTSLTVKQIINYIEFHSLITNRMIIIPTHHHFDHAGGILGLMDYFHEKDVNVSVLTTRKMKGFLMDLARVNEPAKKQFSRLMGTLKAIPEDLIEVIGSKEKFDLGHGQELSLLSTPGHSEDHVSPIIHVDGVPSLCFFGEALGINLRKELVPLPACTAPGFDKKKYIHSIREIQKLEPEIGIFSHVGGIRGREKIKKLCDTAIDKLEKVITFVRWEYLHHTQATSELVDVMMNRYKNYIATCVMDDNIVNNLAFLLVYGILKHLNYKP